MFYISDPPAHAAQPLHSRSPLPGNGAGHPLRGQDLLCKEHLQLGIGFILLRNFRRRQVSSPYVICDQLVAAWILLRCRDGYNSPWIEDAWPCEYLYSGQGIEYQILAGPVFVVVGTVSALVFGALSDKFNRLKWEKQQGASRFMHGERTFRHILFCRPLLLGIATSVASICGMLMGTAQEYWHLVLLRMITSSG